MSFGNQFAKRLEKEHDSIDLKCRANDCPNNWSVGTSNLCSAHAWVDALHWPRITQEQQRASLQRQNERRMAERVNTGPTSNLTSMEKKRIMRSLLDLPSNPDHRSWAKKLKAREQAGEQLSLVQQKFWREALREPRTSKQVA